MIVDVGDLVTRESYNNDIVFKITDIKDSIATLKGVKIRLIADSPISDLKKYEKDIDDSLVEETNIEKIKINRINRRKF